MRNDLLTRIEECMPRFSKGQKRIAAYIGEHYDKAAFMTALRLGATIGVSESTVVRFATELGFEGYPQLQRALQEMIRNRLTSVQRMEVANDRFGGSDVLQKVLQTDMDTIKKTLEETDGAAFEAAVSDIIAARRIYIIGIRSSAALAAFLGHYFTQMFPDARNVDTASTSGIFEQLLRVGREDVLLCITFSRYSRRTLKAAEFAKSRGARVVAITDSLQAPVAQVADEVLVAKSDMASFVDSLVAPLSLINALIVAIGLQKQEELSETYARLESIWDEYNVYDKGDGGNED